MVKKEGIYIIQINIDCNLFIAVGICSAGSTIVFLIRIGPGLVFGSIVIVN